MEDGWIKLWRKIIDNPIFKDDGLYKCFTYCLLKANHKEGEFMVGGKMVKCLPGEFIIGRHVANKELGWKSHRFDDKCKFLQKHGFLDRFTDNLFTKISIINWDTYQSINIKDGQVNGQVTDNLRTSNGQVTDTNKNVKNEKNVKKKSIPSPDFISSLKQNLAYSHIDIDNELHKMDAWLLLPKNKGRKKTSRFILNWISKIEKPFPIENKQPNSPKEPQPPNWIKEALKNGWK